MERDYDPAGGNYVEKRVETTYVRPGVGSNLASRPCVMPRLENWKSRLSRLAARDRRREIVDGKSIVGEIIATARREAYFKKVGSIKKHS